MGRKMKLIPFLHKPTQPPPSSWPWPSCGIPKTLSFREEMMNNSVRVNSSVCDLSADTIKQEEEEDSSCEGSDKTIENVIRQARSSTDRLFFDKHIAEATSCILGDHEHQRQLAKTDKKCADMNKNNFVSTSSYISSSSDSRVVVMEMDSTDPFEDFKKSMQEVVEASGFNLKDDRDLLHQLLSWYLSVNCKSNHGYIVGAFIDLLVSLEISSASNTSFSSSTSSSSGTSSCDNDRKSSSDLSSATVVTEPPISDLSFSSNCSNDPCLLTLFEEEDDEEDAAGLDHRLTRDQEENKISETN